MVLLGCQEVFGSLDSSAIQGWSSTPNWADLPSGNLLHSKLEHGHRNSEFSHKKMVIFHSYVSLPEGKDYICFFSFFHGLSDFLDELYRHSIWTDKEQ